MKSPADRIASAPKAWAVKTAAGLVPSAVAAPEEIDDFRALANEQFPSDFKIVRVAIVETGGEP